MSPRSAARCCDSGSERRQGGERVGRHPRLAQPIAPTQGSTARGLGSTHPPAPGTHALYPRPLLACSRALRLCKSDAICAPFALCQASAAAAHGPCATCPVASVASSATATTHQQQPGTGRSLHASVHSHPSYFSSAPSLPLLSDRSCKVGSWRPALPQFPVNRTTRRLLRSSLSREEITRRLSLALAAFLSHLLPRPPPHPPSSSSSSPQYLPTSST